MSDGRAFPFPFPMIPALMLAVAASGLQAQTIKPGLWEIRQQPQLDPQRQAQLDMVQKQLAALPPEQRKMMEQMMASKGVSVQLGQGGAMTIKSCLSKEQSDRALMPRTEGKCQHDVQRTGNSLRGHFQCTDPASEGETELVFQGDDRYTTRTEIRVAREGRTETIRATGDARWVGSDCGTLKPMDTAK